MLPATQRSRQRRNRRFPLFSKGLFQQSIKCQNPSKPTLQFHLPPSSTFCIIIINIIIILMMMRRFLFLIYPNLPHLISRLPIRKPELIVMPFESTRSQGVVAATIAAKKEFQGLVTKFSVGGGCFGVKCPYDNDTFVE